MAGCGAVHRHFGIVVFVVARHEYGVDFPESEWSSLESSYMVRDNEGTLFHFPEPDECTSLVSRA